jgi:hypothetical protein
MEGQHQDAALFGYAVRLARVFKSYVFCFFPYPEIWAQQNGHN